MDDEKKNNKFKCAAHDDANSQYYHIIVFDNQFYMKGYSGKVRIVEPFGPDVWKNFVNYFLRIVIKSQYYPGSFRGIQEIKFFDNKRGLPVVTLNKGYLVWEPSYVLNAQWNEARDKAESAIVKLYSLPAPPTQLQLQQIQHRYRYSDKPHHAWDSTDLSPRFQTDKALAAFCSDKIAQGYPEEEVVNYLRKYREKNFNKG